MSAIADLHITSYDIVFAKDGHVLLRYSAEGSHCGQPHNGIEASGNKAKWSAAAIFEVKDGRVHSFTKEWDKLNMWKQLGWVCSLFTASVCGSGPRFELQGFCWGVSSGSEIALSALFSCLFAWSFTLKHKS